MRDSLVSLLQTVRLIYSVSRYYNTSERTSSLMIKITNQMIAACRDYITKRDRETVWGQDRIAARSKLKHCLHLNKYSSNFSLIDDSIRSKIVSYVIAVTSLLYLFYDYENFIIFIHNAKISI